jgi:hypothetical protein
MVILYFGFWSQEAKKALRGSHEDNKLYVLNRIKYNFRNFNILHSIIPTKHPFHQLAFDNCAASLDCRLAFSTGILVSLQS